MLTQMLSKHVAPNHLLFDRQLLYSSKTKSTVVRNVTVLSSTTDKINRLSTFFGTGGDIYM